MAKDFDEKRGRKFDQVLEGAMQVFMEHGFEGASVDEIARVAGVSKATLYSYFPDKEKLFMAVARHKFQSKAEIVLQDFDFSQPPKVILSKAANLFLTSLLTDFDCSVYRIAVGEALRFPNLSRDFYENGPMLLRRLLVSYFELAQSRGELKIDHMEMAADQFAELCKADLCYKNVLGIRKEFTVAEIEFVASEAVKTFLARYGT